MSSFLDAHKDFRNRSWRLIRVMQDWVKLAPGLPAYTQQHTHAHRDEVIAEMRLAVEELAAAVDTFDNRKCDETWTALGESLAKAQKTLARLPR
jgi:hypothetical protein